MVKQVIVLRTDLQMRKGKMVAQGAHASMKVFTDRATPGDPMVIPLWPEAVEWFADIYTKVCVGIEGEAALLELKTKADTAAIPCALVQDVGKTEFHGVPTYTALAIGPGRAEEIDKVTGHLKLL